MNYEWVWEVYMQNGTLVLSRKHLIGVLVNGQSNADLYNRMRWFALVYPESTRPMSNDSQALA